LCWSEALQNIDIYNTSYENVIPDIDYTKTFCYLDPPYKPISKTSAFTSYNKETFDDENQEQLKAYCDLLNNKGCKFIQSNSDTGTDYFKNLYKDYTIETVQAKRMINSDKTKRGNINEILIKNY
jgi:DNA adenine methylase